VSGPSGAGKDTLINSLRERQPRMRLSVSATTRAPRPGERDGIDYLFLDRHTFEERRERGDFLEWREYQGNLYGTPRSFIEQVLREGDDLITKPEVNGALAIRAAYPAAALIFVVPDRFSHLRSRLLARRTETNEEIARRLEIAHEEMQFVRRFDYLVINEEMRPEQAVEDLEAIVRAERYRIHRYADSMLEDLKTQ
jgi:guanylate kinase